MSNQILASSIDTDALSEQMSQHGFLLDNEAEWNGKLVHIESNETLNPSDSIEADNIALFMWTWVSDDCLDDDDDYFSVASPPFGEALDLVSEGDDPGAYVAFTIGYTTMLDMIEKEEAKEAA